MRKLVFIYGTRPEAIKLAKLIKLTKSHSLFETFVISTGQQKDLIDEVNLSLELTPDINLNLMKKNEPFEKQHSRYAKEIASVFDIIKPDAVIVHGDTATALSAADAAYELNIPIFHVEAGLRTGNIAVPYPEEYIRYKIGQIATLHFAPTTTAEQNLLSEKASGNIIVTGNTEIDTLISTLKIEVNLKEIYPVINFSKKIIFVTIHRTENRGNNLKNIYNALVEISNRDDVQIIYSIHPNRIIQKAANQLKRRKNIFLIEPPSPVVAHNIIKNAYLLISDSGGLQEDAAYLQKPILILRNETERTEVIKQNVGVLVGSNTESIISNALKLLINKDEYNKMCDGQSLYGDGTASEKILDRIIQYFN